MKISDLEPLVKAGARLLDERQPGWYDKFTPVVLKRFNPRDEYNDVLGTVYGSFHEGLRQTGLWDYEDPYAEASEYGFDFDERFEQEYNDQMVSELWADLEILWREVIIDRQENGAPDA